MKKLVLFLVSFISLYVVSLSIAAQQIVKIEVRAVDILEVSGDPGNLLINKTPGEHPKDATDISTSYRIITNGINKKITGQVDETMPPNCVLKIKLDAPTGASSKGDVILSEIFASNLVTDINTLTENDLMITYTFSASIDADTFGPLPRIVTLTLTDD